MEGGFREKGGNLVTAKARSTIAWGGDLCHLVSMRGHDMVRNARRKAKDAGACQMYNAFRAISRVRDTVILIHGPRGCAQTLSLFTKFFDGFKMQGKAMNHRNGQRVVDCLKQV